MHDSYILTHVLYIIITDLQLPPDFGGDRRVFKLFWLTQHLRRAGAFGRVQILPKSRKPKEARHQGYYERDFINSFKRFVSTNLPFVN